MTDIDDAIRAGLDADDRAFLASLDDERGLFRQIGDSLGGPLGGWAKLVFALTFVLSAVMFYSVWQLFAADEPRELALWATATIVLVPVRIEHRPHRLVRDVAHPHVRGRRLFRRHGIADEPGHVEGNRQ